jgi:hypothetical protein
MNEYVAMVEWYWQGKLKYWGKKPVPVQLCPPQILYGLTWDRNWASAVEDRPLTAWTMAQSIHVIIFMQSVIHGNQWEAVWPHLLQDTNHRTLELAPSATVAWHSAAEFWYQTAAVIISDRRGYAQELPPVIKMTTLSQLHWLYSVKCSVDCQWQIRKSKGKGKVVCVHNMKAYGGVDV